MAGLIQKVLSWLGVMGTIVASYVTLPKITIPLGNNQVWRLDQDLPTWALGLLVVILVVVVLKVVTHILWRLVIGVVILALIGLILSRFLNVPLPTTF
ncbi:hypothetical protein KKC17_00685 [Patescibacteria group bacterium]|nr:hypothetical protein [Patescibacteria group bacterium]